MTLFVMPLISNARCKITLVTYEKIKYATRNNHIVYIAEVGTLTSYSVKYLYIVLKFNEFTFSFHKLLLIIFEFEPQVQYIEFNINSFFLKYHALTE